MRLYLGFAEYRTKSGKKSCHMFRANGARNVSEAEREILIRMEYKAKELTGFSHITGIRAVYFANQIKTK